MHSRNKDGIFVSRCSSRHRLFSAARHQHWNAPRATFQCRVSAFAFQRHTEFLTGLMSSSTESANLLAPFGELAQKLASCSPTPHSGPLSLYRMKETSLRYWSC